jgi:tetratricopeptide (TPR) repeat protein
VLAAALVLGAVWGTMVAYQSHQSQTTRQAALTRFAVATRAYNNGDYVTAAREFLGAAQISPGSDVGRMARRNAVTALLAQGSRQERRDSPGAERTYGEVLRIDPDNAQAYASLAVIYFNRGAHTQAFAYWDRALALWTDQIGRGTLDADEMRSARQGLSIAEQNYGSALWTHAETLFGQRRIPEATQFWQRVLQVAPGSQVAIWAQNRLNTVGNAGMGIFPSYMGAAQ